jgi:hypothetical protein
MQTSNWSRGLFGPAGDQNMRVSDAERQAVADRLAVHYGDGRLDQEEFDERVSRAMSAKTRADLAGLLDDLPEPDPSMAGAGPAGAPGIPIRPADGVASRRRRHNHPVIAFVIIAIIALSIAHTMTWVFVPWLWIGAIVLIVLAATGHLGHHHHHH